MPRTAFWAPITAQRYLDPFEKGGADDYFSSDYTNEELKERLRHVGQIHNASSSGKKFKVLVAVSGADKYVPSHIDKSSLTDRLVAAMNSECPEDDLVAYRLFIDTGNHNLKEGPKDGQVSVDKFADFLKTR